jgi:hypothetical protein
VLSGVPLLVCLIGGTTWDVLNGFPIVRGVFRDVLIGSFYRECSRGVLNGSPIVRGELPGLFNRGCYQGRALCF